MDTPVILSSQFSNILTNLFAHMPQVDQWNLSRTCRYLHARFAEFKKNTSKDADGLPIACRYLSRKYDGAMMKCVKNLHQLCLSPFLQKVKQAKLRHPPSMTQKQFFIRCICIGAHVDEGRALAMLRIFIKVLNIDEIEIVAHSHLLNSACAAGKLRMVEFALSFPFKLKSKNKAFPHVCTELTHRQEDAISERIACANLLRSRIDGALTEVKDILRAALFSGSMAMTKYIFSTIDYTSQMVCGAVILTVRSRQIKCSNIAPVLINLILPRLTKSHIHIVFAFMCVSDNIDIAQHILDEIHDATRSVPQNSIYAQIVHHSITVNKRNVAQFLINNGITMCNKCGIPAEACMAALD